MKALGTLVAASLLVLAGCGDREPEVQLDDLVPDETVAPVSDLTYEGAEWDEWQPHYGEMRPADEAAVAEISQRVTDLNASSWTVHESTSESEISYTPEHVRMRSDHLDLHFAPAENLYVSDMTACLEEGCSELDPSDDVDTDAERLVEVVRGAAFVFPMQLGLVEEIEEPLDEGASAITTLESPAGPVDCLIVAEKQRDLGALVGQPFVLERREGADSFVGWCVDQRGLVLADYNEYRQVPWYDAWRSGVDEDVTELVPAPEVTETPVDPTGDYEDVLWATWKGEYQDVHEATDADVSRLQDRVAALNATSWTGVLDGYGAELAVSPEHARADMGFGEWHFDAAASAPFQAGYVLCVHEEKACVRVGEDADPGDAPHVFNNDIDSMTFTWQVVLGAQKDGAAGLAPDQPVLSAVVDSPVGPLDCLVAGNDPSALEGTRVGEESDLGDAPWCVDQRGLVQQVSEGGLFGLRMPYTSWHAGVDEGFDEIPYRVRDYND